MTQRTEKGATVYLEVGSLVDYGNLACSLTHDLRSEALAISLKEFDETSQMLTLILYIGFRVRRTRIIN